MKSVDDYLRLNYRKSVYQDEEGDWIVEVPDLPGCMADGGTVNEAFENLREAMRSWIESRLAAGLAVAEPRSEEYSGKLLLRMPKFLHRRLAEQAEEQEASLNQYIVSLLSQASVNALSVPATAWQGRRVPMKVLSPIGAVFADWTEASQVHVADIAIATLDPFRNYWGQSVFGVERTQRKVPSGGEEINQPSRQPRQLV
jgi:antitoxin HicB